jgi:hypothetical protein
MASTEGNLFRDDCFAEPALGDAGAEHLGDLHDFILGVHRAGADQHGDLFAFVEDLRRGLQIRFVRNDVGDGAAHAAERVIVLLRRFGHCRFLLNILGEDDAGDCLLVQCDAESAINAVAHGGGTHHRHAVFAGDIFEERLKIDFLLVLAADGGGRGLANDCDDGLVVHLGVVKTVQKVNRAGATGGHADTYGAGELCVGASHEGC